MLWDFLDAGLPRIFERRCVKVEEMLRRARLAKIRQFCSQVLVRFCFMKRAKSFPCRLVFARAYIIRRAVSCIDPAGYRCG